MTRSPLQVVVNALSIWSHVGKETRLYRQLEPRAKAILAALAEEGYALYRRDECALFPAEGDDPPFYLVPADSGENP